MAETDPTVRTKGLAAPAIREDRPPEQPASSLRPVPRPQGTEASGGPIPSTGSKGSASAPVAERARRDAERRERIAVAVGRIVAGEDDASIGAHLREAYGVDGAQSRRDVAGAWKQLADEAAAHTPAEILGRAVRQRDETVRRAFEKGDIRVALSALDSREKLLGVSGAELLSADPTPETFLQLARLASQTAQAMEAPE